MKTLVENNSVEYVYNQLDIALKIEKTIDSIKLWVDENNYQMTGNIDIDKLHQIKKLSKNQMKQIQKYCFWIQRKPSLKRVNSFFSLLSRIFEVERVHIKVSLKEENIQKAKKEWIKARNESDKLLAIYKEEKGNFYKN